MKKNFTFLFLCLFAVYGVSVHGANETIIRNGLISKGSVYITDTTQSTTKDNGSMVTEGGMGIEKNLNVGGDLGVTGLITGSNISGTNTGDVSLGAFGSSPNSSAASLSGQALTLQPADATNPGGVSTTTQTFAGNKTFSGTLQANSSVIHKETGGGSDTVSIQAPSNVTSSYVMKWPIAQGGSSTYLMNDGSGNLSFTSVTSGSTSLRSWSGAHGTDCSWARTSISLGDPTADASCTFTEIVNVNFGSVASYVSGSDELPGIIFTPDSAGTYLVTVNFTSSSNTNGAIQYLRLQEGTGTIIGEQALNNPTLGDFTSTTITGLYTAASAVATTIKLTTAANGSAQTTIAAAGATVNHAVMWTLVKVSD